jgi:hypothetical protein
MPCQSCIRPTLAPGLAAIKLFAADSLRHRINGWRAPTSNCFQTFTDPEPRWQAWLRGSRCPWQRPNGIALSLAPRVCEFKGTQSLTVLKKNGVILLYGYFPEGKPPWSDGSVILAIRGHAVQENEI